MDPTDQTIYAVDFTGQTRWSYSFERDHEPALTQNTYLEIDPLTETLVASTSGHGITRFDLDGTRECEWTFKTGIRGRQRGLLAYNGVLYIVTTWGLYRVDLETGEVTHLVEVGITSLALYDGDLLLSSGRYISRATPDEGDVLWEYTVPNDDFGGRLSTDYVGIAGQTAYVTVGDTLVAIDEETQTNLRIG
ncbi:PQQ-binding-like beta-propeller repeat protein [Natrarchaeobius chitinivorans]|uniref:Uncharacterized protein n=1 Tax=Natrarchaeobius chitinivorans TaxID=1679083 RepID=A0A3N6M1S3_NATCH|nr:PQQ-binding-like beta-propeller repeat protein [Natrarchaeobius chitinivorans]RQG89720.1 hypothetical protein EA473_21400 [Natrarchaeobius chitinivorans]